MSGKKTIFFWAVLFGMIAAGLGAGAAAFAGGEREAMVRDARRFADAYPGAGLSLKEAGDGLYVVGGGGSFLFSLWQGCPQALPDDPADAPLCATVAQPYPVGDGGRHPAPGFDPGRVRNEAFLKALYGKDAAEVEKSLESVNFLGETWKFSSRHGAAVALRRAVARLEAAAARDPKLKGYILPGGGTYFWRKIKDSPRLSAHSFGICIDLNIEKGLYWLWHPSAAHVAKTRQDYPQTIVDIFESEGFIWGGKWHSFDFMHFEYRPELVGRAAAR